MKGVSVEDNRGSRQRNNIGALRLILASLVIVSHSPEIIDGNRSREPLTWMFGTMSFGELAVDGFFLLSGYLISKSFAEAKSTSQYFLKRIARIIPGYFVCFAICYFIVARFSGSSENNLTLYALEQFISQTSRLLPPFVDGVFPGLPYPGLNGPMWTIAYEARCYIVVAILGLAFTASPFTIAGLAAVVMAALTINAMGLLDQCSIPASLERNIGHVGPTVRFIGVFGCGALFYLFRNRVRLKSRYACLAAVALLLSFSTPRLAEAALVLFGGYILFFLCFKASVPRLFAWTNKIDLSYGIYLYAWPIGSMIAFRDRTIHPLLLTLATMVLAAGAAALSWFLIERPALRLVRGVIAEPGDQRKLGVTSLSMPTSRRATETPSP